MPGRAATLRLADATRMRDFAYSRRLSLGVVARLLLFRARRGNPARGGIPMETGDAIFDLVKRQLVSLRIVGLDEDAIGRESLLVDDLGVDSLKFVALTVLLEEALAIPEFPMQHWVDQCRRQAQPLTVAALMRACGEVRDDYRAGHPPSVRRG